MRSLRDRMTVWRIGDANGRFDIYSGEGAALYPGRWNRKGQAVIYTAEHYGTALLEKLVHYNNVLPPHQHFMEITIPAGVCYEIVTKDSLPGWEKRSSKVAQAFGATWIAEKRSCLLFVPSIVSREEHNILINPDHKDAALITPGKEKPVCWDDRLFS